VKKRKERPGENSGQIEVRHYEIDETHVTIVSFLLSRFPVTPTATMSAPNYDGQSQDQKRVYNYVLM